MKNISRVLSFLVMLMTFAGTASAARLKDIADIEGVRGNQLFGYGVVIGLNGTGDGKITFTNNSLSNMLEKMGVRVDPKDIKVKNVASVLLTANLPAFSRPGSKIDVTLSSLGDAKSIQGGTLLMSPLRGADGNTYAVAQGPVSVGGFSVESGGDSAQKNHPTVGLISGGAYVERAIPFDLFQAKRVRIVLREPDFTTVNNVVGQINNFIGRPLAVAVDGSSVEVPLPGALMKDPVGLISRLEHLEVPIDIGAKVIVNERTGTIIMGENVRVSKVALAHGNLNIAIRSDTQASQPTAALGGGEALAITNTDLNATEEVRSLQVLEGQVTLGELVNGLNALGATPRDLISIFAALKRAGALQAEMVIM